MSDPTPLQALQQAILNLPCKSTQPALRQADRYEVGYRFGHHDALYAAAELVAGYGASLPAAAPSVLPVADFPRETLADIADGLESGYERTVNVGNVTGEGDEHLESTTAYAAHFIRAFLASPTGVAAAPTEQPSDEPTGGLYHVKLLQDCLRYITTNGAGNPGLSQRVRWAIDCEKARYESDCAALASPAPAAAPAQLAPTPGALDALLTQIINRRVTIEQRMFNAAAGKRPMPDANELREWAIYLGTPAAPAAAPSAAPQQQPGWKLVPVKPTQAMLHAAYAAFVGAAQGLNSFNARERAYAAMLDHVPASPSMGAQRGSAGDAGATDAQRYRAIRAALLGGGPEWAKLAALLNIAPDTPVGVDDAVDVALGLAGDAACLNKGDSA